MVGDFTLVEIPVHMKFKFFYCHLLNNYMRDERDASYVYFSYDFLAL